MTFSLSKTFFVWLKDNPRKLLQATRQEVNSASIIRQQKNKKTTDYKRFGSLEQTNPWHFFNYTAFIIMPGIGG